VLKRYERFYEEDIAISRNTQKVILDRIKNRKYVIDSVDLKVSFKDALNIRIALEDILKKEPNNIEVRNAINDIIKV
jgi:hypothetical protein